MLRLLLTLSLGLFTASALAAQTAAESALREILQTEQITNVSYKVHEDGFINIVFSGRMMDQDYERVLDRLNRHPDIPGVLAARETDVFCRP
jgi:hypothetical protein